MNYRSSHCYRAVNQPTKLSVAKLTRRAKTGLSCLAMAGLVGVVGLSQCMGTLASALSISGVYTSNGPTTGGNQVTIKGEGFLKTIEEKDEIVQVVGVVTKKDYDGNVVALTKHGKVYSYGSNYYGEAGTGKECARLEASERSTDPVDCYYNEPQDITHWFSENGDKVVKLARVGDYYRPLSFALADSGNVYVWGNSCNLELTPQDVAGDSKCTDYIRPTTIEGIDSKYKIQNIYAENTGVVLITQKSILTYINSQWRETDLSAVLGDYNLQDIGFTRTVEGNREITLLTSNNRLLIPRSTCSVSEIDKCMDIDDITSQLDAPVSSLANSFILTNSGTVYLLSGDDNGYKVVNISVVLNATLPPIVKIISSDPLMLTREGQLIYIDNGSIVNTTDYMTGEPVRYISMNGYGYNYVTKTNTNKVCSVYYPLGRSHEAEENKPIPHCVTIPLETTRTQTPTVSRITFGNVSTTNFQVIDDSTITATVPPHAVGKVDVKLHPIDSADKTVTLGNGYEYLGSSDDNQPSLNHNEQIIPSAPNTGV